MLGIAGNNSNSIKYTLATLVVIFTVRLLMVLPSGQLPTLLDAYVALRDSALTTLVIWLSNKGIQLKQNEQPSQ